MALSLSLHTRHDASMTISNQDKILKYFEFEKIIGRRYFCFSEGPNFLQETKEWILPLIRDVFPEISKINVCWVSPDQREILEKIFKNRIFEKKKHHLSHAYSLYAFTKPCKSDLIISFDGGGDENDSYKIFVWDNDNIKLQKEVKLNLGTPYRMLGFISSEINSSYPIEYNTNLHLPGKIMGLCPLGEIIDEYILPLTDYYMNFKKGHISIYNRLLQLLINLNVDFDANLKTGIIESRNILRTSQYVFEKLFIENSIEYLNTERYKRILLTGGGALNVKLNSTIYQTFKKEVFVSPVSNDCGISIGAAMSDLVPHNYPHFKDAFIGAEINGNLDEFVKKYKGQKTDAVQIAHLLNQGKIIAIMTGRIEAGPRALGNRSIIASPLVKGIKDRLNIIKNREFFRPIAPLVTEEMQNILFEECPSSKYMTFAPKIKSNYQTVLSEIVHFDGTCRLQTVTQNEAFLYRLLVEFGKLSGFEVLVNTSFNSKGEPILNDIEMAFNLFLNSEIDIFYVEGYLFEKKCD